MTAFQCIQLGSRMVCLESPDLAITEAAVGAGVTSILFFATLKKIQAIRIEKEKQKEGNAQNE